jgi:Mor family transcriptional regulator
MYAPLFDIIEAIGLGGAMKLVEHFGGTRIYLPLPENVTSDHEIARVIGVDETRALAKLWGQERPSIPLAKRHLRAIMKTEVQRDKDSHTVPELARKYRTTERSIYRLLAEDDDEDDASQAGLF